MLTNTLVIAAFVVVAIAIAVLARVVVARRKGQPMPEGVLLQRLTWLVAIALALALSAAYGFATGKIGGTAANDVGTTTTPPAATGTRTTPTKTGTFATPPHPTTKTATSTTSTTPATPTTATTPAKSPTGCDATQALATPLPGFALEPVLPAQQAALHTEFPKAASVAARTLRNASGTGTLAAQLIAICPASTNVQGTLNGVLQAQQAQLQQQTGEPIVSTSFTVGRTVVQGRRSRSTDHYAGAWAGATTVMLLRNTTTAEAEPVLRRIVPSLRR